MVSAERPLTITVDSDIVGNIAEIALERFEAESDSTNNDAWPSPP